MWSRESETTHLSILAADVQGLERTADRNFRSHGQNWERSIANLDSQRQTVISQFYQIDRLVVEGGKEGRQKDGNDIIRTKQAG